MQHSKFGFPHLSTLNHMLYGIINPTRSRLCIRILYNLQGCVKTGALLRGGLEGMEEGLEVISINLNHRSGKPVMLYTRPHSPRSLSKIHSKMAIRAGYI